MKKKIILLLIVLIFPNIVDAKRGCCSHHGGVAGCSSSGRQICKDGTLSPSCTCSSSSKSNTNSSIKEKQEVYGCTDANAYNYNAKATKDNGSCIEKKYGCMDKKAINYDKNANTKNESCQYEKNEIAEENISYEVEYKDTNINKDGNEKIIQQGKNGKKEVTYKIVEDAQGNILSKEKVSENIIEEPVKEIIETSTISLEKFSTKIDVDSMENENEENNNVFLGIWMFSLLISFICFCTHKEWNLLLNKIANLENKVTRIILYTSYVILIIPTFIDSVFCIVKMVKNVMKN